MRAALDKLEIKVENSKIQELLAEIDENNDGNVDLEEFRLLFEMLTTEHPQPKEEEKKLAESIINIQPAEANTQVEFQAPDVIEDEVVEDKMDYENFMNEGDLPDVVDVQQSTKLSTQKTKELFKGGKPALT